MTVNAVRPSLFQHCSKCDKCPCEGDECEHCEVRISSVQNTTNEAHLKQHFNGTTASPHFIPLFFFSVFQGCSSCFLCPILCDTICTPGKYSYSYRERTIIWLLFVAFLYFCINRFIRWPCRRAHWVPLRVRTLISKNTFIFSCMFLCCILIWWQQRYYMLGIPLRQCWVTSCPNLCFAGVLHLYSEQQPFDPTMWLHEGLRSGLDLSDSSYEPDSGQKKGQHEGFNSRLDTFFLFSQLWNESWKNPPHYFHFLYLMICWLYICNATWRIIIDC